MILQGLSSSVLLQEISLRVPRPNARLQETFYIGKRGKGPLKHSFLTRACSLYNILEKKSQNNKLDILSQSKEEFEQYLSEVIAM